MVSLLKYTLNPDYAIVIIIKLLLLLLAAPLSLLYCHAAKRPAIGWPRQMHGRSSALHSDLISRSIQAFSMPAVIGKIKQELIHTIQTV